MFSKMFVLNVFICMAVFLLIAVDSYLFRANFLYYFLQGTLTVVFITSVFFALLWPVIFMIPKINRKFKVIHEATASARYLPLLDLINNNVKSDAAPRLVRFSNKTINAFAGFYGGRQQCVLMTTGIMASFDSQTVLPLVAHELGHITKNHLWWYIALYVVMSAVTFNLALMFGRWDGLLYVHLNLSLHQYLHYCLHYFFVQLVRLSIPAAFLACLVARQFEYSADRYAASLTSPSAIIRALRIMKIRRNRSVLTFAKKYPGCIKPVILWLYRFCFLIDVVHPSLAKRAKALQQWN